jgi:protoporphyrinogen/coproporphyrinogen III oxidase
MSKSVIVIGGGISGLTASWWLNRAGVDVTVLEKDASVGGTMKTIHDNGWLIETGPNSALETTPVFSEMFEGLGILGERLYPDAKADVRYILRNGELHPLPMSPGKFLSSRLWTLGGKLRLLKEPFVGRADKEETIAEFVERRLGREFLDYAINPFVAGVYAGNPEQLSVQAAFPKLYALEKNYGGLIKGMIRGARERKKRAEKSKDRAKLFAFTNGMQTFPNAIAHTLGNRIRVNCDVASVTRDGSSGRFQVLFREAGVEQMASASSVILATPTTAAGTILGSLATSLADLLKQIHYPPVAEVFLGFREDQLARPLDGFGFLIPAKEQRRILGTIWSSALFPNRAPKGHAALVSFVGGSRQPELAELGEQELVNVVTEELHSIMHISGEPVFSKVVRWQKAIPQYNLGYAKIAEAIERCEEANPGLFFCSNFKGGIAVGDCVMNGKKVSDKVLQLKA